MKYFKYIIPILMSALGSLILFLSDTKFKKNILKYGPECYSNIKSLRRKLTPSFDEKKKKFRFALPKLKKINTRILLRKVKYALGLRTSYKTFYAKISTFPWTTPQSILDGMENPDVLYTFK